MRLARTIAAFIVLSLVPSIALAERWDGRLNETYSDVLGNEDLGARLDFNAGVDNLGAPTAWGGMYGVGMIFGEDLELFAAECRVVAGDNRESYGGLRVAGIQLVSSSEAGRQSFNDEEVLSVSTPHIPLFTLGGVVTFSLELGASAGYDLSYYITPTRILGTIRGSIHAFAQAEVSFSADLLGGIASVGVRAVVRFFDRRFTVTQEVAQHHRWWNPRVRDNGVSLQLEMFAEVIGLPALSLIIVDVSTGTSTTYLY